MSPTKVAALCVLSVITGFALRGLVSGDRTTTEPTAAEDAPGIDDPGPWSVANGIPIGFARSTEGAVAAAVSYVSTGQLLIDAAPTAIPDLVRVYASADTADQQIADILEQLDALQGTLSGGSGRARYMQAVVATRIESSSEQQCRVSLWSVGVLWRNGAAEPQAGWTTSTLDLVWEADTWRVWSESTVSGPTPAPNGDAPVSGSDLDRLLESFETWTVRP